MSTDHYKMESRIPVEEREAHKKLAEPPVVKTDKPDEFLIPSLGKTFKFVHLRNESVTLKPGESWSPKPECEAIIYMLWTDPGTMGELRFTFNNEVHTHSAEALAFLKPPNRMAKLLDAYVAAVFHSTTETEVQYIAADLIKEHSEPLASAIHDWLANVGLKMHLHVRPQDTVTASINNPSPIYFLAVVKEPMK